MRKFRNIILLLFASAVLINVLLYTSFTGNEGLLTTKDASLVDSILYRTMFYLHIFFGGIALLMCTIQLIFTLKKWSAHRIVGRIYVIGVALSSVGGIYISMFADYGIIAQSGFFILGVLWLYTTFKALYFIKNDNRIEHGRWITRSIALTFAAITLRILMPISILSGLDLNFAYPVIAWLCWVPNLLIANIFYTTNGRISAVLKNA